MSALDDIRSRNEEAKSHFTDGQYPQQVRDIDYMLDLLKPRPSTDPLSQLEIVGSAALTKMKAGRRIIDATGDVWFKLEDGRWSFRNVTTSSPQHLVQVFGPIRALPDDFNAQPALEGATE